MKNEDVVSKNSVHVRVRDFLAPPALLEPTTLRLQKLRLCSGNSAFTWATLAVPGISSPAGMDDTSPWNMVVSRARKLTSETPCSGGKNGTPSSRPAGGVPFSSEQPRHATVRGGVVRAKRKTKEKADYRMVVCFSLAPPVGLEPTTLRLTAACSAD